MSKPLPKSLHTITALIRVARHLQSTTGRGMTNLTALDEAFLIFGYSIDNDPAELLGKSLKVMDAEDAKRVA